MIQLSSPRLLLWVFGSFVDVVCYYWLSRCVDRLYPTFLHQMYTALLEKDFLQTRLLPNHIGLTPLFKSPNIYGVFLTLPVHCRKIILITRDFMSRDGPLSCPVWSNLLPSCPFLLVPTKVYPTAATTFFTPQPAMDSIGVDHGQGISNGRPVLRIHSVCANASEQAVFAYRTNR